MQSSELHSSANETQWDDDAKHKKVLKDDSRVTFFFFLAQLTVLSASLITAAWPQTNMNMDFLAEFLAWSICRVG